MIVIILYILLYVLTRVWVLRTPKAAQNMLFQHFLHQKAKKQRKSKKFSAKFNKNDFLSLHKNAGQMYVCLQT